MKDNIQQTLKIIKHYISNKSDWDTSIVFADIKNTDLPEVAKFFKTLPGVGSSFSLERLDLPNIESFDLHALSPNKNTVYTEVKNSKLSRDDKRKLVSASAVEIHKNLSAQDPTKPLDVAELSELMDKYNKSSGELEKLLANRRIKPARHLIKLNNTLSHQGKSEMLAIRGAEVYKKLSDHASANPLDLEELSKLMMRQPSKLRKENSNKKK